MSNAANALRVLKSKVPKFILNDLVRPVPRDILENGSGQGVVGGTARDLMSFSRSPELLRLRVQHNSYPIFECGSHCRHGDMVDRVRFRYMRQWIESGHDKGGLAESPLLSLAMDALDESLNAEQLASVKLEAGEMLYCNNMSWRIRVARSRTTTNPTWIGTMSSCGCRCIMSATKVETKGHRYGSTLRRFAIACTTPTYQQTEYIVLQQRYPSSSCPDGDGQSTHNHNKHHHQDYYHQQPRTKSRSAQLIPWSILCGEAGEGVQ